MLINQFDSEAEAAKEALTDWEKARSISGSNSDMTTNNELDQKIRQLEKGKSDVEKFVQGLQVKLESTDVDLEQILNDLQPSLANFTLVFNESRSLLNYRYTVIQKNDINRRITAVNSSRMISNADMGSLQNLWTSILGMPNDKRLLASKKVFEARLKDWENLIEQKANSRNSVQP